MSEYLYLGHDVSKCKVIAENSKLKLLHLYGSAQILRNQLYYKIMHQSMRLELCLANYKEMLLVAIL